MKYSLVLLCAIAAMFATREVHSQRKFSADERRIITITDERRDADSLIPYLSSPNVRVARRAAIGIANIGDTNVRDALIKHFFREKRDSVADAEAFAIGMLGPSQTSFEVLMLTTPQRPTLERLKAMARVAPKGYEASAAKMPGKLAEENKIDRLTEAKAYIEFALHKATILNMLDELELLASNDNPEVRWRAAYAFVRGDDSLDLASRLPKLKELLIDQGSPYIRMFAASALGKVHNSDAELALYRAYKSEQDWRVRVNILNAFTRWAKFDSLIFEPIARATVGATEEDPTAVNLGLTAQDVLERLLTAGTFTSTDSARMRIWLDEFSGTNERHDDLAPIVGARATINAARLHTASIYPAIQHYALSGDQAARILAVKAAALDDDPATFARLLESMPAVNNVERLVRLEALDSIWQRAKKNPAMMKELETPHYANIYRHLLIYVSKVTPMDPALVVTSLEHLKDSMVVVDTFGRDAERMLTEYLHTFNRQETRDQLLSTVVALGWLHARSDDIVTGLHFAYDSARSWYDTELMDSIRSTIAVAGASAPNLLPPLKRVSKIDWNAIEHLPGKIGIDLEHGYIELKLLVDDAPLTCLNMVRLAQRQYLSNQVFHRVVPNFVIQAGDPSSTGWGGPGYAIRSEFTPLEYDREGVAGMASSGKDTEGSQWFIIESPTPHLDTRYTIWAEVTSGMPSALKVVQGDRIEAMNAFR
jgi:cyclophilin family peptidyl-prolyl cis-trans isomerase/HEAT repeat protein